MKLTRALSLIIFFSVTLSSFSQNYQEIKVKHSHVLIARDTVIKALNDTVILLPVGQEYVVEKDKNLRSERFYHKLKAKAYRNNWTKVLYDVLTVESDTNHEHIHQNIEDFLPFDGKGIRKISFLNVPVWTGSVTDTTKHWENWFTNFSNKTHYGTREKVLRNNTFFKEGDIARAHVLADNERFLRQIPYLEDARIYVEQNKDGTLNITVVTKDVYSYGVRLDMNGLKEFDYRLFDRNFLGTGNTFSHAFITNASEKKQYGYEGFIRQDNIRGSFINVEVLYRNAFDRIETSASIDRQFITSEIKYAGGAKTKFLDSRDSLNRGTDSLSFVPFRSGENYIWLGRSYNVGRKSKRNNLSILTSLEEINYFDRPDVSVNRGFLYHEETSLVSSILYTHRKYTKDRKVQRFGITEDIPVGYQFGLDGGWVWREFYQYAYWGVQGAFSTVSTNKIGFNMDVKAGFNKREFGLEDKVFKFNAGAFSALHRLGKFQHRAFFRFNYHTATKILENTRTVIGDKFGVRGLDVIDTDANQRITASYDHVFFAPWYMAGFQFAPYTFVDVAYAAGRFVSESFSGYGLGFRLRNESLVIRTFHIRFGYYPQLSAIEHNRFSFSFSLDDAPRFLDIRPNRPRRVRMN